MKIQTLLGSLALATLSASQFVSRNGLQFQLNGAPFTFAGANTWDIAFQTQDHVHDILNNAKQANFPVLRVAAWNMKDLAHGLEPGNIYFEEWVNGVSTINEGPSGLQMLDYAVQQAEAQGIKFLMILTNEWNDFGGMPTYVRNMMGDGQSQTMFYTDPKIVQKFKDYVAAIVNRYKNSPAIFSWELSNEARCQESNCAGSSILTKWASDMSAHIKSLDSNHMVTFGGFGYMNEGPSAHNWDFQYDGASGEDFSAILSLPTIDFGTVHLYTDNNNAGGGPAWGLQWLKDHDAVAEQVGKPMIIEEIGVNRTSPDLSQTTVMQSYEDYLSSGDAKAVRGVLLWSCDVTAGPLPCGTSDPYAMCKSDEDYQQIVLNFATTMNNKAKIGS